MIGFLHIPKTGGTSIRTAFQDAGFTVWRPRGSRYTLSLPQVDLAGVDVVTGHIVFGALATLPLELVTVLRDPAERWLSHYLAEAGRAGCYPRPSIVPDNLMCRMLSADFVPDPDEAVANLAQFSHVGFTDRLDDTFARLGIAPTHRRVSPVRARPPAWVLVAADEATREDRRLYAAAKRMPMSLTRTLDEHCGRI